MDVKQIPTSKFIGWIESLGLRYERTKASHNHYNYPKGHPKRLQEQLQKEQSVKTFPFFIFTPILKHLAFRKKH